MKVELLQDGIPLEHEHNTTMTIMAAPGYEFERRPQPSCAFHLPSPFPCENFTDRKPLH
jgi:hypothetical protein